MKYSQNKKNIYSFEASPLNFVELKKRLLNLTKKFNETNIHIEHISLGETEKKVILKQFNESSSSTFSDINENSSYFKKKHRYINKKKKKHFLSQYRNYRYSIISILN